MKLSEKQTKILEILRINPFASQQEIADQIKLSRPATANIISQLVEQGYILGKAYVLNSEINEQIVCLGAANIDYKLTIKNKAIMNTSNPCDSKHSLGGVIRNVAENLARLNFGVSLMTLLGQDENGKLLLNESKALMDLKHTEIITNAITGQYTAVLEKNGNLVIGLANMNIFDKMDDKWIKRHSNHLVSARQIIMDCNLSKSAIEEVLKLTNTHNKKVTLIGVSSPKMSNVPKAVKYLDTIITNLDESQNYFNSNESADLLVKKWLEKGINRVVITNGTKGVHFGDCLGIQFMHSLIAPKVIDVTGAGDSFSAGIIYGLLNNNSLKESVNYGLANSYMTVQTKESVRTDLSKENIEKEKEIVINE